MWLEVLRKAPRRTYVFSYTLEGRGLNTEKEKNGHLALIVGQKNWPGLPGTENLELGGVSAAGRKRNRRFAVMMKARKLLQ